MDSEAVARDRGSRSAPRAHRQLRRLARPVRAFRAAGPHTVPAARRLPARSDIRRERRPVRAVSPAPRNRWSEHAGGVSGRATAGIVRPGRRRPDRRRAPGRARSAHHDERLRRSRVPPGRHVQPDPLADNRSPAPADGERVRARPVRRYLARARSRRADHGGQRRRVGRGVRRHDLRIAGQVLSGREPGRRIGGARGSISRQTAERGSS